MTYGPVLLSAELVSVNRLEHLARLGEDAGRDERESNGMLGLYDTVATVGELCSHQAFVGIMMSRILAVAFILVVESVDEFIVTVTGFIILYFGQLLFQVVDTVHTLLLKLLALCQAIVKLVKPLFGFIVGPRAVSRHQEEVKQQSVDVFHM